MASIFGGGRIVRALSRARLGILSICLTHVLAIIVGVIMVNNGSGFALNYRDNLIARADASNQTLAALRQGNRLQAAVLDFGGNLFAGLGSTLGGLGVVFPYPLVAYRGWIGGIVSVDNQHVSRLSQPYEAFYYLSTLFLQLIPYSLAGGIGVNLGLAYYRPRPEYQGEKWLGLPKEALRDVLRVYVLVIPLFFAASLWEFLAR